MSELKERSLEFFKQAIEKKKRDIRSSLGHLALQKKIRTKPPKRISKQMFRQFFENHIIVCKNNFYCCCCCKFLDSHCAAFEHTSEIEHCKFVDRAAASRRSWILLSERTNFELLVSEAIVSFDANNFKCRICNDEIFAIPKLTEHLQSFWHLYYSLRFDRTSIEQLDSTFSIFGDLEESCIIIDIVKTVCPDCVSSTSDSSMTRLMNQVEENRKTSEALMRSTCQIVENIVKELKEMATGRKIRPTRSPLSDIQKSSEAPSREIGSSPKCQNDLLRSEESATIPKVQKVVISQETRSSSSIDSTGTETFTSRIETPPNSQNICSENKRTATSLQKTKPSSPIVQKNTGPSSSGITEPPATRFREARYRRRKWMRSSEGITSKSPEETSRIYLFWKQNFNAWLCKICNKTLTESEGIAKHETEIEHKDLYKKYGCENIRMIEPSVFNCACCNCTIPGTINVLAHLRGIRHSTCLAAKLRDKKTETEGISSTNHSEIIPSDKKQELIVYVQHFQNLSIKKMLKRRIKTQAQSAAMRNFECQYCHLHIVRGDDFHSHLASHISLEFTNPDENANDPHNFGLEKKSTSLLNRVKPNSQNSSFRNERCIEKKTKSNDFQVIFTF